MSAAWVLFVRELRRLSRQPARLVVSVLTPMLVWGVLAMGLGGSLGDGGEAEGGGVSYAAFGLPGAAALVVVFSSIFGAISLIEDRTSGYLQAVLVGPAPGWSVAASKLLGSAAVATVQAVVVLSVSPLLGGLPDAAALAGVLVAAVCMSLFVAGLSLALAWRVGTVAAFHGVMNLVLMPMWLLSGAVFPASASMGWMDTVAAVNPLGWSVSLMRSLLVDADAGVPLAWLWAGTLLSGAFGVAVSIAVVRRPGGNVEGGGASSE